MLRYGLLFRPRTRQPPTTYFERLEIGSDVGFPLPILVSDTAPCLRELIISRCTPWPNNQFGSLTSLILLRQETDVNICSLLDALRRSPRFDELVLEKRDLPRRIELHQRRTGADFLIRIVRARDTADADDGHRPARQFIHRAQDLR